MATCGYLMDEVRRSGATRRAHQVGVVARGGQRWVVGCVRERETVGNGGDGDLAVRGAPSP